MNQTSKNKTLRFVPKISIIIVTYNSEQVIDACLQSILHSRSNTDSFEIIFIDNGSSDKTVAKISNYKNVHIKQLLNKENFGFAKACNQGIQMARGTTILLVNPDTKLEQNTISRSYAFLHSNPTMGIVGCRIVYPSGQIQYSCRKFPTLTGMLASAFGLDKLFPKNKLLGQFKLTYFDYLENRIVDVVSGAFFMIKKEVIRDIGPFDENYFMYAEEMDFCYRAKQNGWEIFFYAGTTIEHEEGHAALNRTIDHEIFLHQHKSTQLFIKKYYSIFKVPFFRLIGLLETGIRMLLYAILYVVKRDLVSREKCQRYKICFLWYIFSSSDLSQGALPVASEPYLKYIFPFFLSPAYSGLFIGETKGKKIIDLEQ